MVKPSPFKSLIDFYVAYVTPIEVDVMRCFFTLRSYNWLTRFFKTMSRLGDGPLWVGTSLGLLAMLDSNTNKTVLALSVATGMSVFLFMSLKHVVGRPRPFESYRGVKCIMAPPDKFSFPSGHTMTAFAVWGVMAMGLPILAPIYLVIAVMIGLSRVFLGLHYPTDVLVGAALGGFIGHSVASLIL